MKVAVLFFGRIGHYDKLFLLKELINTKVDIFYSSDNEQSELVEKFINLYNPIKVINDKIDAQTYLDLNKLNFYAYPNTVTYPPNLNNMTRHFINKLRVFKLLEEHVKNTGVSYDLVICTRLDLQINGLKLTIPEINTIYIPEGEDHTGINDRFAMGDMDTMAKYMNVFNNCYYLLENKLAIPHPETLTLANIKLNNLNIIRLGFTYNIIR
jgi:hypothetical protein